MTEELKALFRTKQAAWDTLQAMGASNVYGKTDEQMVEFDLAYEAAKRVWTEAEIKYRRAIEAAA